jgi:hypothetical protein
MRSKMRLERGALARSEEGKRQATLTIAALWFLGMSGIVIADQASEVAALESQCAAEREAKIKPLRDAEVTKCKAARPDDPSYCERYWSDYGNAKRLSNGTMSPRMFDDLPSCVSAYQARKALNQSGR